MSAHDPREGPEEGHADLSDLQSAPSSVVCDVADLVRARRLVEDLEEHNVPANSIALVGAETKEPPDPDTGSAVAESGAFWALSRSTIAGELAGLVIGAVLGVSMAGLISGLSWPWGLVLGALFGAGVGLAVGAMSVAKYSSPAWDETHEVEETDDHPSRRPSCRRRCHRRRGDGHETSRSRQNRSTGQPGGAMTSDRGSSGVRSSVHIAGHPVHPILIPFPIAFLVAAAATDIASMATADAFWSRASFWLIAAGFLSGVAAAVPGLIDFLTIETARDHLTGWIHLGGNIAALGTAVVNWLLRIDRVDAFIEPWGLVLSLLTAAIIGVTGWTGGELAYRHRIGVTGH